MWVIRTKAGSYYTGRAAGERMIDPDPAEAATYPNRTCAAAARDKLVKDNYPVSTWEAWCEYYETVLR